VGGSVQIDLQPVPGDPEETLRKAEALLRAALSPGAPSAADLRVAAEAYRIAAEARREIQQERDSTSGQLVDILV
jgi:predicted amidohydrolase